MMQEHKFTKHWSKLQYASKSIPGYNSLQIFSPLKSQQDCTGASAKGIYIK